MKDLVAVGLRYSGSAKLTLLGVILTPIFYFLWLVPGILVRLVSSSKDSG